MHFPSLKLRSPYIFYEYKQLISSPGEKFREVLTSTFGLENWLLCSQKGFFRRGGPVPLLGQGANGQGAESIPMNNLSRREIEYNTQVIANGRVEPILEEQNGPTGSVKSPVHNMTSRNRTSDIDIV